MSGHQIWVPGAFTHWDIFQALFSYFNAASMFFFKCCFYNPAACLCLFAFYASAYVCSADSFNSYSSYERQLIFLGFFPHQTYMHCPMVHRTHDRCHLSNHHSVFVFIFSVKWKFLKSRDRASNSVIFTSYHKMERK